jgi:energy-coupling factor transporter transmembrane protein EcfT
MKLIFMGNVIMFVSMVSSYAVFGDPNTPTVIAQVWVIKITLENILTGLTFFVRIASSIYGTLLILTVCNDADLLTTLRLTRIPHYLSMIVALTFRSVQTFFDDVMIIMEARKSWGLDFSKLSFLDKFRCLAAIIIPLLILEFRRMEEISNAADARGYSVFGKKRTDYKLGEAKMKSLDYVILLVLIALLAVIVISTLSGLPIFRMLP